MHKTAIKIPGKRTRDTTKAAVIARKALHRPRGRPLKTKTSKKDDDAPAPLGKEPKKRSLKNIKSKRKMSNLEKLPTELLQTIFLYSLNLDLPRASPVIAGKLSSEVIYSRTIFAAFGPTWKQNYGLRRSMHSSGDIPSFVDPISQSSILRCRWASLQTLLTIRDAWLERSGSEEGIEPIFFNCDEDPNSGQSTQGRFLNPAGASPSEIFYQDFNSFSDIILSKNISMLQRTSWDTYMDVEDGVEIPPSLLTGPWTEEMVKYLFWMVKSGARLEWLTSTSGELAQLGLKNAIATGDLRIIHLLQWAGISERFDREWLIWALQNAGGDRLIVMKSLLFHCKVSQLDGYKFQTAMQKFRDKAERESDQATVEFITELDTYRAADDFIS